MRHGEISIDDYANFSAQRRTSLDADNHLQLGDPKKFAEMMLSLADDDNAPIQSGAGSDAYQTFTSKAAEHIETAKRWKALTLSADSRKDQDPEDILLLIGSFGGCPRA